MKTKYLGKTFNIETLKKRYDLTNKEAEHIKKDKPRYIYNEKTGDVLKINLQSENAPLLLKDFGVKRPIMKNLIKGNQEYIKKDIKVFSTGLSTKKPLTGTVKIVYVCENTSSGNSFSPVLTIKLNKTIINTDELADELTLRLIEKYPILNNRDWSIQIGSYDFISRNDVTLKIDDMKLRDNAPLDICNIYGENVKLIKTNENCVKEYIKQTYKKISTSSIYDLGDEDGVTANEIYDFCKKYRIVLRLFDIEAKLIKSFTPEKRNKSYKKFIAIIYNNHIYPLNNKYLSRIPVKNIKNIVKVEDLNKELLTNLNNGINPDKVNLYHCLKEKKDVITSFQINETIYHSNQDYETVKKIYSSFGISDKLYYTDNLNNTCDKLEKLYIKSNIDSYFPFDSNVGGFHYSNNELEGEFITIDQNGHYAEALKRLNKLIVIDYKTAQYIESPKELKDNYYYNVKINKTSELMPTSGLYSYDELIYCKERGLKFKLLEAIECSYTDNYFKDMIIDLEKKYKNNEITKDEMKNIYCALIGKFENSSTTKTKYVFKKIANQDETKTSEGLVMNLNKKYNIIYDIEENNNIKLTNRVPIRRQVIFEARKMLYEKMKELKLKKEHIKQVKTDAITFIKSGNIKTGSNIGEWKIQHDTKYIKDTEIYDDDFSLKLNSINKKNTLWIDYAGSGKTHYIINQLIPKLDDYIVLSPSHASIKEYRKNKINCSVIQKYLYCELPSNKNIIVDEIGMLKDDHNNILLKCALLGKNIYSFGDFKQLKPVNSEICNGELFLNHLYNKITSLGTNYRNNFSKTYYEKLINMTDKEEIKKEILKYNTKKAYDAETIICYKNETRNKYNECMTKHLNIKFGDIGCKIVCKSNDMHDKDIYNNFYYSIKGMEEENYIITDDVEDKIITKKELMKHFDLGYCRTLYNIQGESIKSFHFALEDLDFIDGRSLYTLISRLKQEKEESDDEFIIDMN